MEVQVEVRVEMHVEVRIELRMEMQVEVRVEVLVEMQVEVRVEVHVEVRVEVRVEAGTKRTRSHGCGNTGAVFAEEQLTAVPHMGGPTGMCTREVQWRAPRGHVLEGMRT